MKLERYREIMPDWHAFLEHAEREEPTVFRVRGGASAEGPVLESLSAQGFIVRPVEGLPGFHQVVDEPHPVSLTFEHWLGRIYVQQASTGVAAPELGPQPGERVLDLCSAPGGKTTHMADLMHDSGALVASEISENRIRGLLGNVYRLGHTNIFVVAGDGRDFPTGARFDRVLVDAPCTGEGTLRRRGGKPPRQSKSFVGFVTGAQRDLLARAVRVTRPGGTILYVTCTFAPEENEAVVSDALATLPVELEPLDLPVAHEPGLTAFDGVRYDPRLEGAARIYPHHFDSGGLFLARLRRLDDGEGGAEHGAGEGPDGQADGPSGYDGWHPVPRAFPGDDVTDASRIVDEGLAEVMDRFGIERDLRELGWILRGGRAWLHTLEGWPMPSWAEGSWRPISVGVRAVEFDSRGRPRPTNDFLRWLAGRITDRVIDLPGDDLRSIMAREPVPTGIDQRGPIALRWRGEVVGRGAVTVDGLKSEIPKARANGLKRIVPDGEG